MKLEEVQQILAGLTQSQRSTLEAAHWRYMAFAGVVLDDEYQVQAKADQETYPQLLKHDAAGISVVSGNRAADFMSTVTGLPRDWCLAWDEHDFFETHGTTVEEAFEADGV